MRSTGGPPAGRPAAPDGRIEVLIVCRAELLQLGLERLLARAPDLKVFTYTRVPAAAGAAREDGAHGMGRAAGAGRVRRVALLSDRQLPDAAAECELIRATFADEVVLLSSRPDMDVLVGCMAADAQAFVMEGDSPPVLLAAIRAAAAGRTYVGQRTLDLLVDWLAQRERARGGAVARAGDHRLLRLLAAGRTTADIAELLGIAPKTVRNRTSRLYRRLGVHSRAAAVRVAEQRGLLDGAD